jgi:hypothetical protein
MKSVGRRLRSRHARAAQLRAQVGFAGHHAIERSEQLDAVASTAGEVSRAKGLRLRVRLAARQEQVNT